MKKITDRIGEKYITNQGYEIEIIEYYNNRNCTIKFNTFQKTVLKNQEYKYIKSGNVRNPYHPIFYGVGFIGEGIFKATLCKRINVDYNKWRNMIARVYSEKEQEKHPTYKDVTVCEEWYNFQNFAKWFYNNYNPETMQGWHLDKDILVKGNKVYSPETCCFVPVEINGLFIKSNVKRGKYPIGVILHAKKYQANLSKNKKQIFLGTFDTPEEAFQAYKIAKETYIKEVADKWKDKISDKVYQALISYQVEITD